MRFSTFTLPTLFLSTLAAPTNPAVDEVAVTADIPITPDLDERQSDTNDLATLVDDLLATISPIATKIGTSYITPSKPMPILIPNPPTPCFLANRTPEDLVASFTGSGLITEVNDVVTEIEGLLTDMVDDVETLVGNVTPSGTTTANVADLATVLKDVLTLVDKVVADVEGAVDLGTSPPLHKQRAPRVFHYERLLTKPVRVVDAVDEIMVSLNDALSDLISSLGDAVGLEDLLAELNNVLAGLDLSALGLPILGGLL